jgi:hypothetical protein
MINAPLITQLLHCQRHRRATRCRVVDNDLTKRACTERLDHGAACGWKSKALVEAERRAWVELPDFVDERPVIVTDRHYYEAPQKWDGGGVVVRVKLGGDTRCEETGE